MAAESSTTFKDRKQDLVTVKPMQIDIPKPRFEPIHSERQDEPSTDSSQDGTPSQEELQSAIGVSINREQIRLASPNTPAAEKAAAMEDMDCFFDGTVEGIEERENACNISNGASTRPETPPSSPPPSAKLPSPWRASPKAFEKSKEQAGGFTEMLPDFGKYMPSFNLPTRPRAPTLKDLSIPSLASILNTVRSQSPTRKGTKKRSNTQGDLKRDWVTVPQHDEQEQKPVLGDSHGGTPQSNKVQIDGNPTSTSNAPLTTISKAPSLRRATSDQSLYLRHVKSSSPSLGDDTRWENVREQVNSRAKAVRDSLQDSNFKFPSLPRLPNFADFLSETKRSRAVSDAEGSRYAKRIEGSFIQLSEASDKPKQLEQLVDQTPKTLPVRFPHLDSALEQLTGDLVVLGGYRGSVLRDAKPPCRQLWVPMKVGLNIRKVNLEVGFNPEDEERTEESVIASGMLSHIGPIDMGRRLLKRLKTCKNVEEGKLRVHDYGYDWRLSPHLLSRKLVQFLESLPSNRPDVEANDRGATVLCHSMGGLITRHVVNYRPELFAGVVYAGVPQHCVNILGPFRNGDEVLLSSKVLTAQVNFSMRSSFVLLPDDGHCFINKETKEEYPVDFYDPADWERYAFSPCVAPTLPAATEKKGMLGTLSDTFPFRNMLSITGKETDPVSNSTETPAEKVFDAKEPHVVDPQPNMATRPANTDCTLPKAEAMAYLTRTLSSILTFHHQRLSPLSLIYANNTPTVCAAQVSSREAIKRADAYDDLKFGSGDGVVLAKAAMLPKGYRAAKGGKIKTERGHVGLLGDLEAVGKALGAVLAARKRGVGLGGAIEASEAR
ncbi:uncharacterized protein KY384_006668 [Bacidia gigantensis]|uniref:uncharacterized protein n=1 Tax=Bacidia gigantensis TaxID=2732470 RepID=UPI001D03FCC1|nr:uncharacterized protein KY384_006668 [Bacidia gigantensis]KAG8528979.1 hypothetical protein KY384_006668 [Bacidia gigantensis]